VPFCLTNRASAAAAVERAATRIWNLPDIRRRGLLEPAWASGRQQQALVRSIPQKDSIRRISAGQGAVLAGTPVEERAAGRFGLALALGIAGSPWKWRHE